MLSWKRGVSACVTTKIMVIMRFNSKPPLLSITIIVDVRALNHPKFNVVSTLSAGAKDNQLGFGFRATTVVSPQIDPPNSLLVRTSGYKSCVCPCMRSKRVYTQTGFLRIYARIYTNFTYKMRIRIYAILVNVRIAYILFKFFAYGQILE